MDISEQHKDLKGNAYWDDLIVGNTGVYKESKIDELVDKYFLGPFENILDIGVGTCELIESYMKKYDLKSATCLDYDEDIINKMKRKHEGKGFSWIVADIFDLSKIQKKYDLIFLLDMLHEVYSFYGRENRNLDCYIDADLGMKYVKLALKNISDIVSPKGAIVITDNILCSERNDVVVRCKSNAVIEAVRYFFDNYTTKKMSYEWVKENEFKINAQHFCTLLTQYNKIKNKDWKRWGIERYETHQYMSIEEYMSVFDAMGFSVYATVETPPLNLSEFNNDFEMISGLKEIPKKRVTLIAIKKESSSS
jgi:cyclopropane fatty-acyl-phospholipid synthase-like methyltransferase